MLDGLPYAAIYGFLLAFALGPVFFTLIETAITKGIKAALFFNLGAFAADVLFIVFVYYSTEKILEKLRNDPNLIIFGGAILVVYGVISYIRTSKNFIKIVREHYSVSTKKNLTGLFFKGFLLNFVNFGVLAGWMGTMIMANALTTTKEGVVLFLGTVLVVFFCTDLAKITLAKKLKSKLTPRFIFKTKKLVSVLIFAFGLILLYQGFFPSDKIIQEIEEQFPLIEQSVNK